MDLRPARVGAVPFDERGGVDHQRRLEPDGQLEERVDEAPYRAQTLAGRTLRLVDEADVDVARQRIDWGGVREVLLEALAVFLVQGEPLAALRRRQHLEPIVPAERPHTVPPC